jgi:hypothetical protein
MSHKLYECSPFIEDHKKEISKVVSRSTIFSPKDIELMIDFIDGVDDVLKAVKIEAVTGNSAWEFLEFIKEKRGLE